MIVNGKIKPLSLSVLFFIAFFLSIVPTTLLALDSQAHINNEYAVVREVTLEPGDTLEIEEESTRKWLIYPLSDYSIIHKHGDKIIKQSRHRRGEPYSIPKNTSSLQNNGISEASFLEFQSRITPSMTNIPGPSFYELSQQGHISEKASKLVKKIFDNTFFRVTEYVMTPCSQLPPHTISNHVIVGISQTFINHKDSKDNSNNHYYLDPMESIWKKAGKYAIDNQSESISHFLTVELKPPERYSNYSP
ncbi:hypothetical protein [Aidingimonas halophila]|uniref:Uncharacterized protein n=1 Tax=Aidingimonas halophila TaxID=574349 RepID=A0A1H2UVE3_9GAMM|nr:hypothetical protein [Aidingimonas halophila]SDW60087.1 hypothetical protein SAMN05443545_102252 [Aidingimonas halophila]